MVSSEYYVRMRFCTDKNNNKNNGILKASVGVPERATYHSPYIFAIQPMFLWEFFYVALKKNSFYMINDAVTKELGYVRDRNKASNLGLDGCKKGRYCKWRVQTKYHLRETGQAMMQERVFFWLNNLFLIIHYVPIGLSKILPRPDHIRETWTR